jgi:hypothetical protein
MPGDSLHAEVEALRARLQSHLDAQLAEFRTRLDAGQQHGPATPTTPATPDTERVPSNQRASAARDAELARTGPQAPHAALQAGNTPGALLADVSIALTRIGESTSLSATLNALLDAAAPHVEHAALFIAPPSGPAGSWTIWRTAADAPVGEPDLIAAAGRSGRIETSADGTRSALPLVVGDRAVAVLHITRAGGSAPDGLAAVLAQHAAATLTRLTAVRLTQVMLGAPGDEDGSARRYAKLLVSEIKLYNEAAVRTGRERGDLLTRLAPEIDRARRLYEQRVPASDDRAALFRRELVHTLAGGDATRLGAAS